MVAVRAAVVVENNTTCSQRVAASNAEGVSTGGLGNRTHPLALHAAAVSLHVEVVGGDICQAGDLEGVGIGDDYGTFCLGIEARGTVKDIPRGGSIHFRPAQGYRGVGGSERLEVGGIHTVRDLRDQEVVHAVTALNGIGSAERHILAATGVAVQRDDDVLEISGTVADDRALNGIDHLERGGIFGIGHHTHLEVTAVAGLVEPEV